MTAILLIDDNHELVNRLREAVGIRINDAEIRTWEPNARDENGHKRFVELTRDDQVRLVVADYDLTGQGMTGLFGSTIVDWCQQALIPVGDFSRANKDALPKEPNLFEMRISTDVEEAAAQIASIYQGFERVRAGIEAAHATAGFERFRSPAAALAAVLNEASDESTFALYATRYGGASSALLERIMRTLGPDAEPDENEISAVLAYICAHLLLNAVLRFPGPIIHSGALAAHCATTNGVSKELSELFSSCAYRGPFHEMGDYYWFDKVQDLLTKWSHDLKIDVEAETVGESNRTVIEAVLKQELPRHDCERCGGKNGGFWCPLTARAVCLRADCSVSTTSWIPRGAQLCRIERTFYDEWAPILGA